MYSQTRSEGIDHKRRRRRRWLLLYLGSIVGAVAAGVTDRAVEHDCALTAHAHLHSRVDSASIEVDGGAPDALHGLPAHAAGTGLLLLADRGDRLEVARDAHPSQWVRQPGQAGNRRNARHRHALEAKPPGPTRLG